MSLHHDRARFDELFTSSYRHVRAFALRRLRDPAAVDDVVSETFFVAWRRLAEVPADPTEALLWLYRVAQYGVLNAARGDRRRQALWARLRTDPGSGDGYRVEALDDFSQSLANAFASLPEADRSILLLAAWEGLGPAGLAAVLACSPGAAATRLSRARSRFEAAVSTAETLSEGGR